MTPLSQFGKWSPDPERRRKAAWELAALILAYAVSFTAITEVVGYTLGLTAAKLWLVLAGTTQLVIGTRAIFRHRD